MAELLAAIRFERGPSARCVRCDCCGSPTLELFRGEQLCAALGCHHGKAIRIEGGPLGDQQLAADVLGTVVDWCHRQLGADARARLEVELLLRDGDPQVFERLLPDPLDRLVFTLDCVWKRSPDVLQRSALRAIDALVRDERGSALLRRATQAGREVRRQTGYWFLTSAWRVRLTDSDVQVVLDPGARELLADPDAALRYMAIYGLGWVDHPLSRHLLERIVDEKTVEGSTTPETTTNVRRAVFSLLEMQALDRADHLRAIVSSWIPEQREDFERHVEYARNRALLPAGAYK